MHEPEHRLKDSQTLPGKSIFGRKNPLLDNMFMRERHNIIKRPYERGINILTEKAVFRQVDQCPGA